MTDPGYSLKLEIPAVEIADFYSSMSDMNKASLVALHEDGTISDKLAARIGHAVRDLIERQTVPDARRSHDYLDFERELIAAVGPEASWIHVGRSRQDMMSTGVSMWLRAAHLVVFEDLSSVRQALLDLASKHTHTIIPIYTHGVQAQPTSAAQYLLAFVAVMERMARRITESFARANRSPLGSGAGTTSLFAINRERLATLLGFDGVVDNAFDANLVAPIDSTLEFVGILSTLAVEVAQLTQDLHTQFYLTDPWLALRPGSMLTGVSSMMPQKRNPRILELLREHASVIIGSAQSMVVLAHNTQSGMTDVRETVTTVVPLRRVHEMLFMLAQTINALAIDPDRSLAEVNREYSAMTNLAEYLVQTAGVPFRDAHEFASQLTDYGRKHGLTPSHLAYAEACRIYLEHTGATLPVSESEFVRAIDPVEIIATRKGRGGPQKAEVERMLAAAGKELSADRHWLTSKRAAAADARAILEDSFTRLAPSAAA